MYYVYILRSIQQPKKLYIGYTSDVFDRLEAHNNGGSVYTKNHMPWELVWYCVYKDKSKAWAFERCLKSHSGRALILNRLS